MNDGRETNTPRATIELPLRGLAGEGAEQQVREALERVPGVLSVDVQVSAYRVRVVYLAAPGTKEAIDAALHGLGVGTPHPHGESGEGPRPA
jgi:copper chaperone CopZ